MEPSLTNIKLNNDFVNVIGTVFNNWTGLKLALEHGAGGTPLETKRKVENLVQSIHNILLNNGDCYDLIDELEIVLDEQFCTIVEDNSCEEVSNELINLYGYWTSNNLEGVLSRLNSFKIKESILVPLSYIGIRNIPQQIRHESDDEMDNGTDRNNGEEMDEDSEWTVVSRKKK